LALAGLAGLAAVAWAAEPRPWQLGMQPSATPVHERLATMHDELLVAISLITVLSRSAGLRDVAVSPHEKPGADPHLAQSPH